MSTEETLYANWRISKAPGDREFAFEKLLEHLTADAKSYGVRHEVVAAQITRKRAGKNPSPADMGMTPEEAAVVLIARIDAIRGIMLRRVLAVGAARWRDGLKKYLAGVGHIGLDHLFILSGEEALNLWAEVMALVMFKPLPEDSRNDYSGRRRDAVDGTLSGMIVDSRVHLTCAIVSPAEGVILPVCLVYCRSVASNLLLKDNVHFQQIVEYDDAKRNEPAVATDEGDIVTMNASGVGAESKGVKTFSEALAIYRTMGTEEQNRLINQTWDCLRPEDRAVIWLSKKMQKSDMADGLPDITPGLPDVSTGSGVSGEEAAKLLGLPNKNAFFKRVYDARLRLEALFTRLLNALLGGDFK